MPNAPQATPVPLDPQFSRFTLGSLSRATPAPWNREREGPITRVPRATTVTLDWGFLRMILVASIGGVFCFWSFSRMLSWAWTVLRASFST